MQFATSSLGLGSVTEVPECYGAEMGQSRISEHPLEAIIAAYNDAWNRHDTSTLLALHTEDSVFENHASGETATGKAAIARMIGRIFLMFPDVHFSFRKIYVRDALVVQEWTAIATHQRPILGRGGTLIRPTGKCLEWDGVDVLPMRDSLILRKDTYLDQASILRQLPEPAP